jgi:sortase A
MPRVLLAAGLLAATAACGADPPASTGSAAEESASVQREDREPPAPGPTAFRTDRAPGGGGSAAPAPSEPPTSTPAGPRPADGEQRRAALSIPALGIQDLPVVPYRGTTDDAPGTAIQDRGNAASPGGPRGGTGPGGVGNYLVTAHRLSSTQAFLDLPDLRRGQRVHVEVREEGARVRYTYEVRTTRRTSFRSQRSLREQRAAVPGRPGAEPTRAMITLSTCATPEDRAAGNDWSDRFGNPEHRIDKIGVLVARRSA